MSEIMTLRTLICENIAAVYGVDFTPQFLLAYNAATGIWTAEVGRDSHLGPNILFGRTYLAGAGATPEQAYRELLKLTAIRVSDVGDHIYIV
ncbi:hypothetical protein KCV07_g7474, partial [Aureobasidium melanogenum]